MKKIVLILLLFFPGFAIAGDYVIGDGDVLQVSVWGVPELSVQVTVRPDGKITLPAAGDVAATGLTPVQLSEKLEKVLRDLVKKPIVTLTVAEINNNKVYVSGGGVPSEVVHLTGRTTLFKFLCRFENLENADLYRAYLMRGGDKLTIDFHALFREGDFSKDVELQAEDILFIPTNELNKIYVLGAVKDPKYVFFRAGMKVLDAILEAGGFTEYAKENNVLIFRKDKEKLKVKVQDLMKGKDVAQNIALAPGDYVIVREGMF
jgi:polysaccharide export outer membrane protein